MDSLTYCIKLSTITLWHWGFSSGVVLLHIKNLNLIVLFVTFLSEKKDLCDCSDNVKNITTMKIYFPSSWFCTPNATAFLFLFLQILSVSSSFFSTSKTNWWPLHYQNTNKYGNKYGKSNFQHFTLIFYLSFILIQSGNYRPYIPWL